MIYISLTFPLPRTSLQKIMEDECLCSPLNWEFYYQHESLEKLRCSFLDTTMELEATILAAKEEIRRRESELIQVNDVLSRVIKERDESQAKCRKLVLEKLELQQQLLQQKPQILQIHEDESPRRSHCSEPSSSTSSSDCEGKNNIGVELFAEIEKKKPLPEKGKLLKAVIEAGPLLQTLLLAGGPLPQWQHPPPQLHSIDIPTLSISSSPILSPLPYKAPLL